MRNPQRGRRHLAGADEWHERWNIRKRVNAQRQPLSLQRGEGHLSSSQSWLLQDTIVSHTIALTLLRREQLPPEGDHQSSWSCCSLHVDCSHERNVQCEPGAEDVVFGGSSPGVVEDLTSSTNGRRLLLRPATGHRLRIMFQRYAEKASCAASTKGLELFNTDRLIA